MQNFTIPAGNNHLAAFLHPARSGANRPVLIVCHGFCGSAEGGSVFDLADSLHERDISLLRFRFTPQRCMSQQVEEINAVAYYCRKYVSQNIALLGRSMGAAASLAFAASDKSLSGLCLMASPSDLFETFRGMLGEHYESLEHGQTITGVYENEPVQLTPEFIQDFDHYDLLGAAHSLAGMPLLIVHGLDDNTVPVAQAHQLYAAAENPKELLLLPGHAHSFAYASERFVPAVADWLTREVFPSCT
ncbi:MAG TPA: alpha/beta hydrolase [Negativicutes bacterium]|nr:alpha/beta hydrolase [Negativicutes bacterium]